MDRLTTSNNYNFTRALTDTKIYDRLAQYENTDLTPSEVVQLKRDNEGLRELAKALLENDDIGNLCEKCVSAECVDAGSEDCEPIFQCGCYICKYASRAKELGVKVFEV